MSDFLADIARDQDAEPGAAETVARAREGLLATRQDPRRRWPVAALVLAAAVTLALLAWPTPSVLEAHRAGEQLRAGAWLQAGGPGVDFSDGSLLELEDGALRLATLDDARVEVVLESGTLVLTPHEGRTEWWLRAGPYAVRARGRVRASWIDGRLELTDPDGLAPLAEAPAVEAAPDEVGEAVSATAQAVPGPAVQQVSRPVATVDWRAVARAGDFAGAWDLLGEDPAATADLSLAEEELLADVARLTGHPEAAQRVLTRLRERAPGSAEAARAAFVLGVLAQDVQRDEAVARRWLTVALDEAPEAPLAEHARGRLVELLHSADDPSASAAARDYLTRHPEGVHAALAREVAR